jgi:hypothetical protein
VSRTLKDRPSRVKHEPWDKDLVRVEGWFRYINLPTTKTKKRRKVDTEWHWMNTPSWWTRLMMNKPQRREGSIWERKAVLTDFSSLLELDTPGVGRKPHVYFW